MKDLHNTLLYIVYAGVLGAMYIALTSLQNLIWPGSATMAVQMRLAEVLCICAFFTPAAIPGLTLGCMIFNLSWSQSLPLDFLVGSLATLGSTWCMWRLKGVRLKGMPWLGLLMPALWNAVLVGWEVTVYLSPNGFSWPLYGINALFVFLGEAIVLLLPGAVAYCAMVRRGLDKRLFSTRDKNRFPPERE